MMDQKVPSNIQDSLNLAIPVEFHIHFILNQTSPRCCIDILIVVPSIDMIPEILRAGFARVPVSGSSTCKAGHFGLCL